MEFKLPPKSDSEPEFIYKKRTEFYNKALKKGYNKSVEELNILSNCYVNKEQFRVSYPENVEKKIKDILNS